MGRRNTSELFLKLYPDGHRTHGSAVVNLRRGNQRGTPESRVRVAERVAGRSRGKARGRKANIAPATPSDSSKWHLRSRIDHLRFSACRS
jgi:hypothetical protein